MTSYLRILSRTIAVVTPQSRPIPGPLPNKSGGHALPLDDGSRLDRFLVLGSAIATTAGWTWCASTPPRPQ